MNRKRAIGFWGVVAIIAATLVVLSLVSEGEPRHDGRSLSEWCKLLWAGTPAQQAQAEKAISAIGTNAVPSLEEMLLSQDSKAKTAFLDLWAKQSIIRYPYLDRDIDKQRLAMKAVAALEQEAMPMLPFLQQFIEDWQNHSVDLVFEASRISRNLDPSSVPVLEAVNGKISLVWDASDPVPMTE